MAKEEILLLNDSFPPLIDGVSNAVVNYARCINKGPYSASVVTPEYPGSDDSAFGYPVIRYPGLDLRKQIGYIAGFPFEPQTIHSLSKRNIGLIHSHCPMASNFLARAIRSQKDVPLVLTYHTKFDIDISNTFHTKTLQHSAIRLLVESVSAA
ncbi:MAG: glycosyltransferase, partial [Spirochaetales bacterium]|nr:glycosyltransferase [Candidatus Physcosoma equi]